MIRWLLVALILVVVWLWFLPTWKGRGFTRPDAEWDPPISVENIITPEQCKAIIAKAEPLFARSTVVADQSVQAVRTSDTAWIKRDDPLVKDIMTRAMELTGKPWENCEDIQVVRYRPGTYYRAHHDSCCESNNSCRDFEKRGGQRVGTLLLYLNDDFTEGHTHFPDYENKKLKASPGSAIFFRPMGTTDQRCHPKALHAGLPIENGTKYVCNIWVREGPFT